MIATLKNLQRYLDVLNVDLERQVLSVNLQFSLSIGLEELTLLWGDSKHLVSWGGQREINSKIIPFV